MSPYIIDASKILDWLSELSDPNGFIYIDEDNLFPDAERFFTNESLWTKATLLTTLMKAYGIAPKKDDFSWAFKGKAIKDEEYIQCFIGEDFSEKRKLKTVKLMKRFFTQYDDLQKLDEMLTSRHERYVMFKCLWRYRKLLYRVEDATVIEGIHSDAEVFVKCIIGESWSIKVFPLQEYVNKLLILLLGDYADRKFNKKELFVNHDYHSVQEDTGCRDLPF